MLKERIAMNRGGGGVLSSDTVAALYVPLQGYGKLLNINNPLYRQEERHQINPKLCSMSSEE